MSDDPLTPEELFARRPEGLVIFRAVQDTTESIGEASVRVTKSQVAFRHRRGFAFVRRPGRHLANDVPAVLPIALARA